jgi:hypothetical protein
MVTNLHEEILDWAVRYLSGEVTLDEFEAWLVPATWDVESSGDKATQELAHDILSMMVELSSDDLTQAEFDSKLRNSVFNIHVSYPAPTGDETHASSTAQIISETFKVPIQSWSVVDYRPIAAGSGSTTGPR